jgi:hypothetical protein
MRQVVEVEIKGRNVWILIKLKVEGRDYYWNRCEFNFLKPRIGKMLWTFLT